MAKFALQRIALSIPTLLAVFTLIFIIVRVIPGDPATAALGDYASQEAVEALRERMGLNEPIYVQYFDFIGGLLRGDLGRSLITSEPVIDQIRFALPHTVELAVAAILIGLVLGIPVGIVTAIYRNTFIDYVGRVLSLAGLSFPAFYLGILLLYFFSVRWGLFPTLGAGDFSDPVKNLHHLALPAISLGLIETAYIGRMTRSVMLNVLNDDFVRTARAKGLPEWAVLVRHAFRAALIPIVSLAGIFAISLIGSSVLTEVVFSRPGLGRMMVGSIRQRDYITVQSIMVVYAVIIVFINLLTDLIYGLVDPRVRY
ncbi:MAG TPA: ABC transporter permease [Thermomicrobiales bacterium]|nr:ABC transporter permease [Thermomicrobiales bacterium]